MRLPRRARLDIFPPAGYVAKKEEKQKRRKDDEYDSHEPFYRDQHRTGVKGNGIC